MKTFFIHSKVIFTSPKEAHFLAVDQEIDTDDFCYLYTKRFEKLWYRPIVVTSGTLTEVNIHADLEVWCTYPYFTAATMGTTIFPNDELIALHLDNYLSQKNIGIGNITDAIN